MQLVELGQAALASEKGKAEMECQIMTSLSCIRMRLLQKSSSKLHLKMSRRPYAYFIFCNVGRRSNIAVSRSWQGRSKRDHLIYLLLVDQNPATTGAKKGYQRAGHSLRTSGLNRRAQCQRRCFACPSRFQNRSIWRSKGGWRTRDPIHNRISSPPRFKSGTDRLKSKTGYSNERELL
ncbi:hypothetical protein AKJ16_DCAP05460 [Drosera capensis]